MTKLLDHNSQALYRVSLESVEEAKITYEVENLFTGHIFLAMSVPEYVDVEIMPYSLRVSSETILLSTQVLALPEAFVINEAGYRLFMGREEGYLFSSDESAPVVEAIEINLCEATGGIVLTDVYKNLLVNYDSAKRVDQRIAY